MKSLLFTLLFIFSNLSLAEDNALFSFVTLKTSMGDIRLKLYKKEAPRTVENFIGLATGSKTFRDVKTGKKVKETPFYKNMIFHKVHPELGIQTGCPWGNGKGWPGYTIKEETNELKFDRPYLVSMSKISNNDNSSGSQFFITTKEEPHLNENYSVFGEVETGQEIVRKISQVPRDAMMKPLTPIKLIEITVEK
jgi:peptidyl-prolyl cis-trans isomerase A (cyclophilin A)